MKLLVVAGIAPFILSFYPPLQFYRNGRGLAFSLLSVFLVFGSWDILATARGHWFFAPEKVGPVRVANLPLEEVLFFVVIPFCCLFTWEALNFLMDRKWRER
jgi:lycopene cyclase domain-containing protein